MDKIVEINIDDKGNNLKFFVKRLKPFEQCNLILRLISIISKGSVDFSSEVEQALHNVMQTGQQIEKTSTKNTNNTPFKLILDAFKGALASLSNDDRDWLINELLKNVTIDFSGIKRKATIDELDTVMSGFQPVFKLMTELVKVNLGFL